jgi:hypothetical protein
MLRPTACRGSSSSPPQGTPTSGDGRQTEPPTPQIRARTSATILATMRYRQSANHQPLPRRPKAVETFFGVLEPAQGRAMTTLTVAGRIVGEVGPGLWVRVSAGAPALRRGDATPRGTDLRPAVGTGHDGAQRERPPSNRNSAPRRGPYSITSSARASRMGGTVRPSVLAVFRLMNSSAFVLCCTGKSAGFSPFRIRPT